MSIKIIQKILIEEENSFKRFEILEHYSKFAQGSSDIDFLLKLILTDNDPMVRHEVAAQLLRMMMFRSDITRGYAHPILGAFKERIQNDSSIVVRHECLEAVGYLGDKDDLAYLQELIEENSHPDVVSTARISLEALKYRLDFSLGPEDFWDKIVEEHILSAKKGTF